MEATANPPALPSYAVNNMSLFSYLAVILNNGIVPNRQSFQPNCDWKQPIFLDSCYQKRPKQSHILVLLVFLPCACPQMTVASNADKHLNFCHFSLFFWHNHKDPLHCPQKCLSLLCWVSVYQETNNPAIGGLAQTLLQQIPKIRSLCQLLLIIYKPQWDYHKNKNLPTSMRAYVSS